MKILLLTHKFSPDFGGIESVSEMLADEFAKLGNEVVVLTWSEHNESDVKFPYRIVRRPSLIKIVREIKKADVIFENNPCLRLSWPNFFLKKKHVIALHTWNEKPDKTVGLPQKIKYQWLKRADKVIACSEAVRKKTFPQAITIGNPYDDKLFKIVPGIDKKKDFVFLGRLVSDKGANLAIEALNKVILNRPDYSESSLTIIGSGPETESLKNQVNVLGITNNVFFTGSMKGQSLVNALNEHRYILIPSLWDEPFGIVVLEGMACGCVPIASDKGGLPDAVGKAGILFNPVNIDTLAKTMESIKSDFQYEEGLRLAAIQHLQNHLSGNIASSYLQVLKSAYQSS